MKSGCTLVELCIVLGDFRTFPRIPTRVSSPGNRPETPSNLEDKLSRCVCAEK